MNSLLSGLSSSAHDIEIKSATVKVEHKDVGERSTFKDANFKDAMDKQVHSSRASDKSDRSSHNDSAKTADSKMVDSDARQSANDTGTQQAKRSDMAKNSQDDAPHSSALNDERQGQSREDPSTDTVTSAPQALSQEEQQANDSENEALSASVQALATSMGETGVVDANISNIAPKINAEAVLSGTAVLADGVAIDDGAAIDETVIDGAITSADSRRVLGQSSDDSGLLPFGLAATQTLSPLSSDQPLGSQNVSSEAALASLALSKEQLTQSGVARPLGGVARDVESRVFNALSGDIGSDTSGLDDTASEGPVKNHLRMELTNLMGGTKPLGNTVVAPANGQPLVSESQMRFDELMMVNTSASAGQERPTLATAAINAFGVSPGGLPNVSEARMQIPVNIRFGEAGWGTMIAERSAMMASKSIKFAELQLDPPELGPLQVKVTVNQEQASVSFVTANAQVREALDQSALKLREMLEEQGLDLVDVDVSDQSSQESDADAESEASETALNDAEQEGLDDASVSSAQVSYGVDHYA